MNWTYEQRTGFLVDPSGAIIAHGYSGNSIDKNNPDSQSIPNKGPLPCGLYVIGAPFSSPTHGPFVLRLTPNAANNMFGRSGFLIHGDSKEHPGCASEGCIILGRATRELIWNSGTHELQVIHG